MHKRTNCRVTIVTTLLLALAPHVARAQEHPAPPSSTCPKDWHYADQSAWCGICASGKVQSPIAFPADMAPTASLTPIRLTYDKYTLHPAHVAGNGQYFEFEVPEGTHNTFTANGATYTFKQFHFHFPAENQVIDSEGRYKAYAGEMHLVHLDSAGKPAAVIAVFVGRTTDRRAAASLDPVVNAVRMRRTPGWESPNFNPSVFLKAPMAYTRFPGSLTSPPCTEGLNWYVLSTPIVATDAQIGTILDAVLNARQPVLPTNGRLVQRYAPPD